MPFAARTDVPVTRSRDALEQLLRRAGATGFVSGWDLAAGTRIEFLWKGLRVRFLLPHRTLAGEKPDQAERRRWRALLLVVKAKLEAVTAGIACFEEEFLPYVVDEATDRTVADYLVPRLRAADGSPRRLLLTTTEAPR